MGLLRKLLRIYSHEGQRIKQILALIAEQRLICAEQHTTLSRKNTFPKTPHIKTTAYFKVFDAHVFPSHSSPCADRFDMPV